MPPISTVVGHTTATTTRILAIFEGGPGSTARIACRDGSGVVHFADVPIKPALPYGLATFHLTGLTGPQVNYAVAQYAVGSAPPDPATMLAGPNAKTFRMVPSGPLRIGLVSCNDIDNHKFPKEQRGALWRRLGTLVAQGEIDLLVHAGDQIYGDDMPQGWAPQEGRAAAYRRHYAQTWSHPDVAAVLGRCPNIMMWDDHEIYDGWGSNDGDATPAAQARFQAANQAFREFQDPLNPPDRLAPGLGWLAKYGDLAILAVDGRSQRSWATGTILGKAQLDDLELKLNDLAQLNLKHLLVVVGTPVVYVPLIAAEKLVRVFSPSGLDDIRDGWTASHNRTECRRFLMSLLNFAGNSPATQVTIVAGDIHVGTVAQIDTTLGFGPNRAHPRIYQVTSSGISRPPPTGFEAFALSLITGGGSQDLFNQDIKGTLSRINGSDHAFCVSHRNFAVLDPSNGHGDWDERGNLWVRFHAEIGEVRVLEQMLARVRVS
ncbi:MAG TPA: alkaline phosphatase D family protein [Polyangiaceae bacterium]|nr:alkaline phosphatase D family protein [Polyangiaceae bacterium]